MRKFSDLLNELDPVSQHFTSSHGVRLNNPYSAPILLDVFTYDLVASPSVTHYMKDEDEYNPFNDDDI